MTVYIVIKRDYQGEKTVYSVYGKEEEAERIAELSNMSAVDQYHVISRVIK